MLEEIKSIIGKVQGLKNDAKLREKGKLPSDAYFLNADEIVCFPRDKGDSRYPYAYDGLTLWAYSSGNMKIEESAFNVLLDFENGKEPTLAFFYGAESGEGFVPVSITGAAKQPAEKSVSRYTVYCPTCVYYVAEGEFLTGAVKMFVDCNKNVQMKVCLFNKSGKTQKTYISGFMNCMLSHAAYEGFENKWYRSCKASDDGFLMKVTEYRSRTSCMYHYGKVARSYDGEAFSTTSLADYKGGANNQLISSVPLRTGKFKENKDYTTFTDVAIVGDMLPITLKAGESKTVGYTLAVGGSEAEVVERAGKIGGVPNGEIYKDIPAVEFDFDCGINNDTFGYFIKSILRQAEFCSRAKNYAGNFIGIRDIFQQLECALLWIPDYCKKKIVEALGYIGDDGRAPRQYSYSRSKDVPPDMDLREYIDQGVWIISTVYRYIAVTGDFSILGEECGYYKFDKGVVSFSDRRDTVSDHLISIADYLLSNVDKVTHCLHVLYGDWNDAVDGLGKTTDEGKDFGTGVSVMATMQLYRNLCELSEILSHEKGRGKEVKKYGEKAEEILRGLGEYAVDVNAKGDKKVVHGWGDKRAYKIGSFNDNDGFSRDSATSNAFWVLSGVNAKNDMKKHIVNAFDRLDGKYGIKTFEPYFSIDNKEVGRITRLPKGTAENGSVYIHATLFAIWSLFELGEYEKAWTQLMKILPLTHEFISTTPFVMPNSYVCNEEIGLDGESMSDWFTGSGCVLGKVLFFCMFGIRPDLEKVEIAPAVLSAAKSMKTTLRIKGGTLTVVYKNSGRGERTFEINGKSVEGVFDPLLNTQKIVLKNEDLRGKNVTVTVCD